MLAIITHVLSHMLTTEDYLLAFIQITKKQTICTINKHDKVDRASGIHPKS